MMCWVEIDDDGSVCNEKIHGSSIGHAAACSSSEVGQLRPTSYHNWLLVVGVGTVGSISFVSDVLNNARDGGRISHNYIMSLRVAQDLRNIHD